jgi:hypothetical protein
LGWAFSASVFPRPFTWPGLGIEAELVHGEDGKDPVISQRETDLSGRVDLDREDLHGADLESANLWDAGLTEADLEEAVQSGADLTGAIVTQE